MTLSPLATVADLSARGITEGNRETALAVASAAIRDAAGSAIRIAAGAINIIATPGSEFLSVPAPIQSIISVEVNGSEVTDYANLGSGLWRRGGWSHCPTVVTVNGAFGLSIVPADIVDMTCALAKEWLNHQAQGGGSTAGLTSVALDDARETYSDEAASAISPVFIPRATREWLRARFGGGAAVVETL